MKAILLTLVLMAGLLPSQAYAQQPVMYNSFAACTESFKGQNISYAEVAAYCNYLQPQRVPPIVTYGSYVPQVTNFPFDGYGYGYVPFWLDPCRSYFPTNSQDPGCVVGEVKFKVLNRGLGDQVVVRINGDNAGLIGKYSHSLTSGLRLRADKRYELTLQWVSKDGIKTIVDHITPMNMRMQDGAYWYPVSRDLFDQAAYGQDVIPEREKIGGKNFIMNDKRQ